MNFPYRWYLKNGYPSKGISHHGLKVFGMFICGGGSTMGYKLAGYDHIGGNEIDSKICAIYAKNHTPEYLYNEDIRTFNRRDDLPECLYHLDILDGSPPCSTFSLAGRREAVWNVEKKFTEGQHRQRLDDLVFCYVETIRKLQPKVAILENVKGLIIGNAKAYAKRIHDLFKDAGYNVQLFLLNAATMGLPQKRERVFFIGLRKDRHKKPLVLNFDQPEIVFKAINPGKGKPISRDSALYQYWKCRKTTDKNVADIKKRLNQKENGFGRVFIDDHSIPKTIVAGNTYLLKNTAHQVAETDLCKISSFPLDYDFSDVNPQWVMAMSVPPVMMACIADQIYQQWFS